MTSSFLTSGGNPFRPPRRSTRSSLTNSPAASGSLHRSARALAIRGIESARCVGLASGSKLRIQSTVLPRIAWSVGSGGRRLWVQLCGRSCRATSRPAGGSSKARRAVAKSVASKGKASSVLGCVMSICQRFALSFHHFAARLSMLCPWEFCACRPSNWDKGVSPAWTTRSCSNQQDRDVPGDRKKPTRHHPHFA
jgi:hypothetical protein